MNIAIIGGGITGLTAAYKLLNSGHTVTVFERETYLGGLAYGFKEKNWKWHLEAAYHHLFTNDTAILDLIKELGLENKLIIKRPITANFYKNATHQFDSPLHLLQFPYLSLTDKLRTGALVAFCKAYPLWQTLEGVTAKELFIRWGGIHAWNVVWEPLMTGKFGHFDSEIAASWLWARIHKRTPSLVYIDGGFHTLISSLEKNIQDRGGTIKTGYCVKSIDSQFDRTLVTTPTQIAEKIFPGIATKQSLSIPHLHAQVLILETKKPILENTYWLSITERTFPFLAVVAHTNFMDKKNFGGNHITYIGNYLPDGHKYLKMSKTQILKEFMPYIKKLCPTMNLKLITNNFLFTAPYAQPVHQIYYSRRAPALNTPIKNVYLANMDSIYPWDRGSNYAVQLGTTAARVLSFRA